MRTLRNVFATNNVTENVRVTVKDDNCYKYYGSVRRLQKVNKKNKSIYIQRWLKIHRKESNQQR